MLVERQTELDQLTRLAREAQQEESSIILVTGEAGIGKSALASAFRKAWEPHLKFYVGGCDALVTPRPLGPVRDMAAMFSRPTRQRLLDDTDQPHLFDTLLTELSGHAQPVVLLVEDVHWADNATLDLLKFLGRRISMWRGILLLTYRDDEVEADHPLIPVIGDFPASRVHRLALSSLSCDGVAALASKTALEIAELHTVTNGNPFFVSEMLATGNENLGQLPESVKDLIGARIARLSTDVREFLETLSIMPSAITPELIDVLFGPKGRNRAIELLGMKLLREDQHGNFRFRHELARRAIMARLREDRVRHLHQAMFDALASLGESAPIDLLVHHADAARLEKKVLRLAPEAASKAVAVGSHREAVSHLETALKYVRSAEPADAAQLWEDWARTACVSTRMAEDVIAGRARAAELWGKLQRPDKVGENLRWQSRLHWYRGEAEQAEAVADEAIRILESAADGFERAMAYSIRSQLFMLKLEMNDAIKWGERALLLARKGNNIEAEIHALNNIGSAMLFQNRNERITHLQKSLSLAIDHSFFPDAARAYINIAEHAVAFHKFELAEQIIEDGVKYCSDNDLEAWVYQLNGQRAEMFLDQGRFDDAANIARSVLEYSQITPVMAMTSSLVIAKIAMRRGDSSAGEQLNACYASAVSAADINHTIKASLALIEYAWLKGEHEIARSQLLSLNEIAPSKVHIYNEGERRVWSQYYKIETSPLNDTPLPEAHRMELSGDFNAAASLHETDGMTYYAALCLMRGADRCAHDFITRAMNFLVPLEASATTKKCYTLAEELKVAIVSPRAKRGPYKKTRNHPLGLTTREAEILSYIVQGDSNKEISLKLSRSPRTVGQHVSAILKKLNVANRVEVILRVQNEPWILSQIKDEC